MTLYGRRQMRTAGQISGLEEEEVTLYFFGCFARPRFESPAPRSALATRG
jgi:hypothetical protein